MKLHSLVLALSVVMAAQAAELSARFKVSTLNFQRPASWESVEPGSPMRKAQLKVVGRDKKDSAEIIFFHFGPSNGGGVQANVERWYRQFSESREKIGARSEEVKVGLHKVTYVQAEGTFMSGIPGGPTTPQPDSALRGAIIESAEGDVFVKMTGPAGLVKSAEGDFRKMVEGALK